MAGWVSEHKAPMVKSIILYILQFTHFMLPHVSETLYELLLLPDIISQSILVTSEKADDLLCSIFHSEFIGHIR